MVLLGKIVTTGNVEGDMISDNADQYVEAQNGSNIFLTIDVNIQSIVEKYLEKGVKDNDAPAGSVILMRPKTGEILAMATYPSYDLNAPFTIPVENTPENPDNQDNQDNPEGEDENTNEQITEEEKKNQLENLWKDRNFASTYEPGSTFKLIVSAAALEEGITDTDVANDFHCEGYTMIGEDTKIGCAQYQVHGNQTLRTALKNSCNAAFIQLGHRISKVTLYKYFEAFGFFERTGVNAGWEISSRFHKLEDVGPVELGTTSFGQRFDITPLQLITAVSAIANDGVLVQPRVVKKVVNPDTGTVTDNETKEVRRVISEKTAKKMRDMMKNNIEDTVKKYGSVVGYTVGGKTGTSEPPINKPDDGYTVSFIAIAPADEPEIVGLVIIYNLEAENSYGSRIAAPIMSDIMSEVLPYMGIASDKSQMTVTTTMKRTKVPDVTNKTLTEAKKSLENVGFKVIYGDTQNSNSVLVTEQVPAKDALVEEGATVVLYTEENSVRTSVEVPNLVRQNFI